MKEQRERRRYTVRSCHVVGEISRSKVRGTAGALKDTPARQRCAAPLVSRESRVQGESAMAHEAPWHPRSRRLSAPGGYAKLARLTARGPLSFRVRVVYWRKYHSEYTGLKAEGRPGCQHHSDVLSNKGLKTSIRVDRTLNITIILFSSKHI
jgi:hypothetical protein